MDHLSAVHRGDACVVEIDLDLDLFRIAGSDKIVVDDEDEFESHTDLYKYPDSLVAQCRAEVAAVRLLMQERRGLFSDLIFQWRPAAPVGAEFSGHIFFNERWFGFDDGIYAAARLIEILSNSEHSLSALLAEFPDSCNTPEILVPVADTAKAQIVSRLVDKANFPHGTLNTLDGLRVDFDDGWGLVRASNTSAALTMRFEAQSDASLIRIRKQFKDQLTAIVPELADKLLLVDLYQDQLILCH